MQAAQRFPGPYLLTLVLGKHYKQPRLKGPSWSLDLVVHRPMRVAIARLTIAG